MSAKHDTTTPPAERITLDQIRHRAEEIQDRAVADAKSAVAAVVDTDATRTLLVVAGVVVIAASLAYYLGSRAHRVIVSDS
ncbi:MAG: hypothetical protein CVT67_03655 [Actinobacteria bacterium HGW-Actinobacteria-7]|jgi:hypothetical protein|nr:MAG: hypothetical protein CVT67_03655 [Actinobacteria bacterium HGW-Actinobacteria-7]